MKQFISIRYNAKRKEIVLNETDRFLVSRIDKIDICNEYAPPPGDEEGGLHIRLFRIKFKIKNRTNFFIIEKYNSATYTLGSRYVCHTGGGRGEIEEKKNAQYDKKIKELFKINKINIKLHIARTNVFD